MTGRSRRWFVPLASIFALIGMSCLATAGSTVPPPGIRENTPRVAALTNARIVTAPGKVIEQGALVVRDGNIVAVGTNVRPPADAYVWDLQGKTIYAGLIDLYTHLGMPKAEEGSRGGSWGRRGPSSSPPAAGTPYWNPRITPQKSAAELFTPNGDAAEKLRGQGITTVLTIPEGPIVSGTGAVVHTGAGLANDVVVKSEAALHISFDIGRWGDEYPGSLMGLIALLRQSYADAEWYTKAHQAWAENPSFGRPERNDALAKLAALKAAGVPVVMDANDEQALLREAKLAAELGVKPVMRGSNYEYRRLDLVKATGAPVILPLDFPEVPSVKTPEEALDVSLEQLRHWYLAPKNAHRLHEAGVQVAFTSDGLKDRGQLLSKVRKLVKDGYDADAALAALTTVPASVVGIDDRHGTIAAGKAADLVITDGDLFADETRIMETWVAGHRYVIESDPESDPRGSWQVSFTQEPHTTDTVMLELKGKAGKPSGKITRGAAAKLDDVRLSGDRLSFSFKGDSLGHEGVVRMSANVTGDRMDGLVTLPDGTEGTWTAARLAAFDPDAQAEKGESEPVEEEGGESAEMAEMKPEKKPLELSPRYPEGAFGRPRLPEQAKLVAFTNATIWTCGPQGILENATLLIASGKVAGVGVNLSVPSDATVVDASGLHITPGLIDCHSHSAIDGNVNESNQTVTAEVRIGDVVDAHDIGIYRELAGGLTIANLLHGSANAIGGHNQVIKLRWGADAEGLKFKAAPPGIKFALGENPKQSNWGDNYTTRYPQSRMGVEEIIRDDFQAALEYGARWDVYNRTKKGAPPRRDLELETVLEVIRGERLVHCHSYRQDEIQMLMRLAEEYGFKIQTFQHVLEGYKVADMMAEHGAGGSCFSDWWAYKFEVYDAIPYNGALMHNEDVVVSFNSDSGELARRLNTEAAKAVKYGGVSPEEALKFVTLNPAKQLRVDDRVGSLEPGKDADVAVWSGDPLSTYSYCLQTWIDGRKYFDRAEDMQMRDEVRAERAALMQEALESGGGKGGAPPRRGKPHYSCKGLIEEGHSHESH